MLATEHEWEPESKLCFASWARNLVVTSEVTKEVKEEHVIVSDKESSKLTMKSIESVILMLYSKLPEDTKYRKTYKFSRERISETEQMIAVKYEYLKVTRGIIK